MLKVYDDWQELINQGSCDVISIATAPMLRSDPLLMAVGHGCHSLVEDPDWRVVRYQTDGTRR
jgi:predicted dehydrogenase